MSWASQTEVTSGPVNLYAGVTPLLGADPVTGGTITFREGATVLGTLKPDAAPADPWAAPVGLSVNLTPGAHTITAAYSGTARWSSSSATTTFHIAQTAAVSAALAVSDLYPALGENVVLTATLTRASGGVPPAAGPVTFYDGNTVLGTGSVLIGGLAAMSTTALTGGAHSIRAVYTGAPGFGTAEAPAVQVNVGRAFTAMTLTVSVPTPVVGQSVALSAVLQTPTSSGVTPRGTVTFYDGSTVLGSAPAGPNGTGIFTVLRVGNHTLRAVYAGDANTLGSEAPPVAVTGGRRP